MERAGHDAPPKRREDMIEVHIIEETSPGSWGVYATSPGRYLAPLSAANQAEAILQYMEKSELYGWPEADIEVRRYS